MRVRDVIQQIAEHSVPSWDLLDGEAYSAADAHELIEAAIAQRLGRVRLRGTITESLVVTSTGLRSLAVEGHVAGDLVLRNVGECRVEVAGRVEQFLIVQGGIKHLEIGGSIGGAVLVQGHVSLNVSVYGSVAWGLVVARADSKDGIGAGVVDGNVVVQGEVGSIDIGGRVGRDVLLLGSCAGDVQIGGVVGGDATIAGTTRGLMLTGSIGQRMEIGGHHAAAVTVSGDIGTGIELTGEFSDSVALTPRGSGVVQLRSTSRARFDRPVHVGDGMSIARCDFRQCGDLDKLDLVGADLFTLPDGSQATELVKPKGVSDGEMASIYRQLRVNLEGKGNRPASAFFYRGEMESRQRAARQQRRWGEWTWISLYRLVAGYGLKVAPPLLWFGILVGLGGVALHALDLGRDWPATFVYTAQAMLSLFRPPDPSDDWRVGLLQIGLRILGPILLGLAAFAVRDKVAR